MKVTTKHINYNIGDVEELLSIEGEDGATIVVSDSNRGGTFVYDGTNIDNDGGTNFNGWVRQYDGAINVKWFGDITLEQTFKDASDTNLGSVFVDLPSYTFTTTTIDFIGLKFHSYRTVTINGTNLIVTNLNP